MSVDRINTLLQMLEKEPHDSFLNYALALELHKSGKIEEAIARIEGVIARDKDYLGAYLQLGQLHEETGNGNKALATYQNGTIIAQKQNNHKALSELNEAIFILEE